MRKTPSRVRVVLQTFRERRRVSFGDGSHSGRFASRHAVIEVVRPFGENNSVEVLSRRDAGAESTVSLFNNRRIAMIRFTSPRNVFTTLMLSALLVPGRVLANNDQRQDDSFTIAVIPDTQNYVDYTHSQPVSLETFKQETGYLASHKRQMNLAFVTHVGDVVQHGDGTNGTPDDVTYGAGIEWDMAKEAMSILADSGVPFGMTPGNHDYDNYSYTTGYQPLQSNVMWSAYFGSHSSLFHGQPWYGGASDRLAFDPGLSSFQIFEAGDKRFLHISLQMEASDAALAWAQGVIDSHKGYATLVTT